MKAPRDQIVDFLRSELVGPDPQKYKKANGEEILVTDPPRIRYGAGVLFPQAALAEKAEDTQPGESPPGLEAPEAVAPRIEIKDDSSAASADDQDQLDDNVALANAYLPSAMGLSCFVELPAEGLLVKVTAGRYVSTKRLYEVNGQQREGVQYERSSIAKEVFFSFERLTGRPVSIASRLLIKA